MRNLRVADTHVCLGRLSVVALICVFSLEGRCALVQLKALWEAGKCLRSLHLFTKHAASQKSKQAWGFCFKKWLFYKNVNSLERQSCPFKCSRLNTPFSSLNEQNSFLKLPFYLKFMSFFLMDNLNHVYCVKTISYNRGKYNI